jgi:hypothetical protein
MLIRCIASLGGTPAAGADADADADASAVAATGGSTNAYTVTATRTAHMIRPNHHHRREPSSKRWS